jgi:hypothetical protein
MKLDQRKIHWIIRQKQKGVTTKQIAQSEYEDIAEASPTNLEKLCREQKKNLQSARTWGAQEAL